MGIDIFSSSNNSLERLIQLESQPRFNIMDRKSAVNKKIAVLTDLDSKLSKLNSLSERLTDPLTDHFGSKAASTNDNSLFTDSATSTALIGNHDILIQRLAASDTRVSKQFDATATDLRIVFKSQQTGYTYRIGMTDSSASLLTTLDINSNVLSSGTAGGYITNIGTSATDSALNSKLQLDGLTFYRDKQCRR